MNGSVPVTAEQKQRDADVISPLANDKTYGEQWYHTIFNKALNYWFNLFASAGFSHWVKHSTTPIKLPFLEKAAPPEIQEQLAEKISKTFLKGMLSKKTVELGLTEAKIVVADRGMSIAKALTLLVPGCFVMIPSVWLGAKGKPWIVETLNKHHYGAEAMEDPSLKARHQAIEAEERPTLLGTAFARAGTVAVVQISARLVGSESNVLNDVGKAANINALKRFKGIDPITGDFGVAVGNAVSGRLQNAINRGARRLNLDWSKEQIKKRLIAENELVAQGLSKPPIGLSWTAEQIKEKMGQYSSATQDFASFVGMDTIYTVLTACTVHPFLKLLRHIPCMVYEPKIDTHGAVFEGDRVKLSENPFADKLSHGDLVTVTPNIANDDRPGANRTAMTKAEIRALETANANDDHIPKIKISDAKSLSTISAKPEQHVAHAG